MEHMHDRRATRERVAPNINYINLILKSKWTEMIYLFSQQLNSMKMTTVAGFIAGAYSDGDLHKMIFHSNNGSGDIRSFVRSFISDASIADTIDILSEWFRRFEPRTL